MPASAACRCGRAPRPACCSRARHPRAAAPLAFRAAVSADSSALAPLSDAGTFAGSSGLTFGRLNILGLGIGLRIGWLRAAGALGADESTQADSSSPPARTRRRNALLQARRSVTRPGFTRLRCRRGRRRSCEAQTGVEPALHLRRIPRQPRRPIAGVDSHRHRLRLSAVFAGSLPAGTHLPVPIHGLSTLTALLCSALFTVNSPSELPARSRLINRARLQRHRHWISLVCRCVPELSIDQNRDRHQRYSCRSPSFAARPPPAAPPLFFAELSALRE